MKKQDIPSTGIRFSITRDNKHVGRAYLFLLINDLHDTPYGILEDLFVDEAYRGQGIGKELLKNVIDTAKEKQCYKLLATSRKSREGVHALYKKIGFEEWGYEFRMNF